MYTAVLFDADGVLTLPEDFFSRAYATKHGLDNQALHDFFMGPFQDTTVGKADLRELLEQHKDIWQYESIDALLDEWFRFEDVRNVELLKLIDELRTKGVYCCIATNQEKYRGNYMREVMFKDSLDGFYISNEMGCMKPKPEYFEAILADLGQRYPGLQPHEVLFLDDTQPNVDAAKALGIDAYFYHDVAQARSLLQ